MEGAQNLLAPCSARQVRAGIGLAQPSLRLFVGLLSPQSAQRFALSREGARVPEADAARRLLSGDHAGSPN